MGYFSENFLLRGAAPHFNAWKSAFIDKLLTRYPFSLREYNDILRINHKTQWVRVKLKVEGSDIHITTTYASTLIVLGFLFFFSALLPFLIVFSIPSIYLWASNIFTGTIPTGAFFFISGVCCFGINEEMNIHKAIVFMARKSWEEVQANSNLTITREKPPVSSQQFPTASSFDSQNPSPPPSPTNTQPQYCAFCGARRPPNTRFCEQCGGEFT